MAATTENVPGGADELAMLEKVFFRIASANSDEELTSAVGKYLPPILLKLSSSREGVRKKILEMLVHVNKRIKNNDNIMLPMDALLVQYQDPSAISFVTNFTIIYIKMGFPRLSSSKAAELVPAILKSLDGKPEPQQDALLLMIIPVLGQVIPPSEDPNVKQVYLGLSERPVIAKLFKQFLLDYLLIPYGSHPSIKSTEPISTRVPAGLSENSWKRVSGDTPIKAEDLEKTKMNVVKFLGKSLLPEMEIALHLVVAMADTRHSVANEADTVMRKFSGQIEWNDPILISKIYSLFLGTFVAKDKEKSKQNPKPEFRRVPANTRLRLKLMPHLLKSREAALQFPACVQVTFDLLFGTGGNSNAKLRTMAIAFIHHLIDQCPESQIGAIGPVLMSALKRLIEKGAALDQQPQDDESATPESRQAIAIMTKLRASAYIAIGKLGRRLPKLVNHDISVMQTFFEAMAKEDKETQLSLQEAMSLMAPAFKMMDPTNLSFVEAMLGSHIESEESQVRLVAAQYAGEVFPSNHVPSRYILLLGAGDSREEISRVAMSNLYGALSRAREKSKMANGAGVAPKPLPDFVQMLVIVMDKANIRMRSQLRVVIGNVQLAFPPKAYEEMLNFLRMCLMMDAGVNLPERDELNHPQSSGPKVTKFLETLNKDPRNVIGKFAEFTEKFLTASPGIAQSQCLLQLLACSPSLLKNYSGRLNWLKGFLNNTREDIRESVAKLYAIVSASLDLDNFIKAMTDLQKGFKEKTVEFQHGLVVALGLSFGRLVLLSKKEVLKQKGFWQPFREALKMIVGLLSHQQPLLASAACLAVGEIGRCGPMVETRGAVDELEGKAVAELLRLMKSEKVSMKVRERAAMSVGHICIGDTSFPDRKKILDFFLEAAGDIKEVELHLTMGEALVHAAFGPLSPAGRDYWAVSEEEFTPIVEPNFSDDMIEWLLKELIEKHTGSLKPNVRQASCLWLLALVKNGMRSAKIRSKLLEIQSAFMRLLTDNNDIIQDAASKGVGLVYDSSSEEQRKELVNILLQTLGGKPTAVTKVTEDTKVFEEGQLGKAPGGDNLSTYKELCSLASDINPELVYQFMHLANNNAIWQSRLGGAFGFSSIAAKAGEQLEPYLPKILPKLYRYQFDPVSKIQTAMNSIWNALVQDTTKTIDLYLPHIMQELQSNLTNNQWRIREACCCGLQDIVRGRSLDTVLDIVPSVWRDLFRVMDDIKESVRNAAAKAVQALSRACIKMCDITQSPKSGDAAVRAILPTLIEKGLGSDVSDVRAAALAVVMKISRSAGALLKPHLSVLIPALLVATGEMEGKELNYYSTRLATDAVIQEKLDSARIAAARASPMMDCVNYVLQFVDSQTLITLAPQLIDLIRQPGIALGTKGATVHVIASITHQCPFDLQQYTGKFLAAFVFGLSDRNLAVRKMYASSIGHLLKTAKDSSVEKLFEKMKNWYIEKDEESSRIAVALTFQAITRHNPDKMKAHAATAMPIAFLAMHEQKTEVNTEIIEVWEEVWSEGTPGTEGGIRLYLRELIPLLTSTIESPQWRLKALAARAMATVAVKSGESLPLPDLKTLLTFLVNALGGRTWTGKESVLVALRDVITSNPNNVKIVMREDENLREEIIVDQLMKECLKERKEYRIVAMEATGKILQRLQLDHFTTLYEILQPVVAPVKMDDSDEPNQDVDLESAVIECLASAWPDTLETQKRHLVEIITFLTERVDNTTRKNQLVIATTVGALVTKLNIDPVFDEDYETIFSRVGQILSALLSVPKSAQLRSKSVEVTEKVLEVLTDCGHPDKLYLFKRQISQSLDDVIKDLGGEAASKDVARQIKLKLAEIKDPENSEDEEAKTS